MLGGMVDDDSQMDEVIYNRVKIRLEREYGHRNIIPFEEDHSLIIKYYDVDVKWMSDSG